VGIKIVDPELHQTTDVNFPGAAVAADDLQAVDQQVAALDAGCFVLAGSLPPGVDSSIYERLITTLKARGKRVVLDASGESLRPALGARPHLIKPNIHELGELLGAMPVGEREVVAAARSLIATGIEQVVVSMGKDGACFVTAEEAVVGRPPEVEVRSTVGAGDAMVAGIVSAQLRKLSLVETARIATAFSVHALTRAKDTGDFSATIAAWVPRVTVKSL
jgi:1-phosphofructokinase